LLNYKYNNITMVKNFGGNKGKKQARKLVSAPRDNRLRTPNPDEPDEQLACVSKMLGNGMCNVVCGDNSTKLCIIRNKFRGRSKRHNTIIPGSYVLVDIRSWETATKTVQKCDLLEVYNKAEMNKLVDTVSFDWNVFKGIGTHESSDKKDSIDDYDFEFGDNDTFELEKDIREHTKKTLSSSTTILDDYEGHIDIDDI